MGTSRHYSAYSRNAAHLLGKQIRLCWKEKRWTETELAGRAGISGATLEELLHCAERVEKGLPVSPELDLALHHGTSIRGARPESYRSIVGDNLKSCIIVCYIHFRRYSPRSQRHHQACRQAAQWYEKKSLPGRGLKGALL